MPTQFPQLSFSKMLHEFIWHFKIIRGSSFNAPKNQTGKRNKLRSMVQKGRIDKSGCSACSDDDISRGRRHTLVCR